MNKQELLQLEKLAFLTPKEIEKQEPEIYAIVNSSVTKDFKDSIGSRLKNVSKNAAEEFDKLDFTKEKLGAVNIKRLLKERLIKSDTTEDKKKEIEGEFLNIPKLEKLDDVLQPDTPLIANPVFYRKLAEAKLYRLSDVAGVAENKMTKVVAKNINVADITGDTIELLINEKVLNEKEAIKLKDTVNLYTLFDSSIELTEYVASKKNMGSVEDLVSIRTEEWQTIIKDTGIQLPDELSVEDYATVISKKIESLFPEKAMLYGLDKPDSGSIKNSLNKVAPLFKNNPDVFGVSGFEDLNIEGIPASELDGLAKEYDSLRGIVNQYPGLKLAEVFNNRDISIDDKNIKVADNVGLLDRFVKNNPDSNYLTYNFAHDSEDVKSLNFQGFKPEEAKMVLGTIKSQQRIFSFTNDIADTQKLLKAGYHSSFQVTSVTFEEFLKTSKLDIKIAEKYYENAHQAIIRSTGVMGSILDILTGSFNWTAVGNTSSGVLDYLRDIPGYQDLFGELAFCDCEHCQSIYSPAAYFVDLMQFVERYVLSKHFSGLKSTHVLNLKVRRPDLWSLPLTCENTSTLIPYLDIINEILESFIAKKKGFAGDLGDRSAVESFVYKQEIGLEKPNWKDEVHSFKQPFHLPITSTATYLRHFDKTRADVAVLLGKTKAEVAKAIFNFSEKDYTLVTVSDNNSAFLKRVYDIAFTLTAGKITPVNSQLLLKSVGVSHKEFERLCKSAFITADGADVIAIKSEKKDADSIQNDIERVHHLTYDVLDRMHRFVRLWRRTSWTIDELDLVLSNLKSYGVSTGITPDTITALGSLMQLQQLLKTTVPELMGICFAIPVRMINEEKKSLFDALFNHSDIVKSEGLYPKAGTKMILPAFIVDKSTAPAEFTASRLMAALNRAEDEVLLLVSSLANSLGIVDLQGVSEADRGFNITQSNLSLLYRHSSVARQLNLSVADLFRSIDLIPSIANGYLENVTNIFDLVKFVHWRKSSKYLLDDLHFISETGNILEPDRYQDSTEIAAYIRSQIQATNCLYFADTLFTSFEGITETQSRSIVSANNATIEQAANGGRFLLRKAFNPATPIVVPAGILVPEVELRELLIQYHAQYLIPFHLSNQLLLTEHSISSIITRLGIGLDDDGFTEEIQDLTIAPLNIQSLVKKLLPLSVLFRNQQLKETAIQYVLDNLLLFEIADIDVISTRSIRLISLFGEYVKVKDDGTDNVADLAAVLDAFDAVTLFQAADQELLANLLNVKPEQLAGMHAVVMGSTNAIDVLERYGQIAGVCNFIGLGAGSLPGILASDYNDLNIANSALLAAFISKYKNEDERKEKLEKYQDIIRGKKRAALTTYLIHSGFPQFERESDLFHYFLIDTELEGCARTSRLVAATMSVQLYIHRVLLNLEQDDQEPGTAGRVHVLAKDIPGEEWEWRKNYRVWEANRKVFLYPENYIEPELRDDKTPLFKELEDELLQKEVNADNVLDAYSRYMRGFDELAHLKIAGSFHEKDAESTTDVLHLFGVTAGDPPTYFYRRIENIYYAEKEDNRGVDWGAWVKVNVQVPVRNVAPIIYNGRLHAFWIRCTSLANTVFDNNRSIFTGYSHKFFVEFTTLKLDGTWTPPQKLSVKNTYPFEGNGVLQDPLAEDAERDAFTGALQDAMRSFPFFDFSSLNDEIRALRTPRYDFQPHYEPKDEYTLDGFMWDQLMPAVDGRKNLVLNGVGYQLRGAVDFYNLRTEETGGVISPGRETWTLNLNTPGKLVVKEGSSLFRGKSPVAIWHDNFAYSSLLLNAQKNDPLLARHWNSSNLDICFDNIKQNSGAVIGRVQPYKNDAQVINGSFSDVIIDAQGDLLILQGSTVDGNGFLLKRLGTTISETLTRTLFTSGVETMLSVETQKKLKEVAAPITIMGSTITNLVVRDKIDFKGAYGNYYREIFFHIPFLLANHLNSQGKYKEAQQWYHYIFNPSANEVIDFSAPGLTAAQKKRMALDRNWQYLEFRGIDSQKLRDQLNDKQAIEVYKKDPFNPHAIARLRLSAYQKTIVMKYIDNLLDWGDQLFTMDTMESINEATLLYVIAKEILGERPAEIGDCGEGKVHPKSYANILPLLNRGSEFLAELESYTIVKTPTRVKDAVIKRKVDADYIYAAASKYTKTNARAKQKKYTATRTGSTLVLNEMLEREGKDPTVKVTTVKPADDAATGLFAVGTTRALSWKKHSMYTRDKFKLGSFGYSILRHISPVFCVPGNKDLLDYYNRVEDRLFKVRNCMNIQGQRRQLALFAPEIDPRLLVRAKAAGLSLDDILNSTSGNLPPYRFAYILERAKAFTSVVQNFGAALLSAIERKNTEELSMLRMNQQQMILELSAKSRRIEIDSANKGIEAMYDRIESLNYQIGYYNSLIEERINGWEELQSVGRHGSSVIRGTEAAVGTVAGFLCLIPQIGSPFAMKYGGAELGSSMSAFAFAMQSLANLGDNIAASAGLEAGFDRRTEGWKHQQKLLQSELKQAQKNLIATEWRRDLLIEAQKIHEKSMEHNQDVIDFYGEKFSNLGLYTWLSATMQRLFKEAYNNAIAIARLAEQAYKYERDDDTVFIDGSYFDASRAGLLAGEKLNLALQTMEKRYLETNYRKNEIDQAFSLAQINPSALLTLKQTGECTFNIPEICFDLFYPGHYRRRIQSVRLSIPSITGPYTNVSATLSLTGSQLRMEPSLDNGVLKDVPKSRTTSIATSSSQNDAGVFHVNFRDDRYMPFEGSGAISSWKLSLPKNFRQFDYDTINDVILHISYTAEYDELFRDNVESLTNDVEGALIHTLKNNPLARILSLRQEFSGDYHRLVNHPVNTPVAIKIQNKHFPLFMNGKVLKVSKAALILVTEPEESVNDVEVSINGVSQTGFTRNPAFGNLFSKDLGNLFNAGIIKEHTLAILDAGDLEDENPAGGMVRAFDDSKIGDIVLYLEYSI
jgi:hypothetical protein